MLSRLLSGDRYALALILALTAVAYAGGLDGDFVLDDRPFLVDNPNLHSPLAFFTAGSWEFSRLQLTDAPIYRPLYVMLLYANHASWGSDVEGYHLTSLAFHLINCVLLALLLRRLAVEDLSRWLGVAFFALTPLHVEAVSWICAINHLWSTMMLLLIALLSCPIAGGQERGLLAGGLSCLLFAAALFTNEIAVSFPLLILAVGYRQRRRYLFWLGGGTGAIVLIYLMARSFAMPVTIPVDFANLRDIDRLTDFLAGYVRYLILPWPQILDLGDRTAPLTGWVTRLAVLGGLGYLGFAAWRHRPWPPALAFGLLWLAITLIPLGIAVLNPKPLFSLRSLYLPSAGLAIMVASLCSLAGDHSRALLKACGAAVLMAFSVATYTATAGWHDDEAAYRRIIAFSPTSAAAHNGLGRTLMGAGRNEEAIVNFERALQFSETARDRAINGELLGLLHGTAGRLDVSREHYRQVLEIDPAVTGAWVGLGNIAWQQGDLDAAIRHYERALETSARDLNAIANLALAYRQRGREEEARALEARAAAVRGR